MCIACKQQDCSSKRGERQATKPLKIVHSNVCGLMKTTSTDGAWGAHSMSICTQRALKIIYPYITCHR